MKDWDARLYREHTGFVSELGVPLIDLLAPRAGERILDLGCGDGVLTRRLVDLGCEVVAMDASPDMVHAARSCGIDARLVNARDLSESGFEAAFDAVFSNAALHWMHPMEVVARGIAHVLKPGGRLVAEFGGQGNIGRIRGMLYEVLGERGLDAAAMDPWCFPSGDEYSRLLIEQGFEIEHIDLFERPTELPSGMKQWLVSVARPFIRGIPETEQPRFLQEVESRLEPALCSDDGIWRADYVRLRVRATKRSEP